MHRIARIILIGATSVALATTGVAAAQPSAPAGSNATGSAQPAAPPPHPSAASQAAVSAGSPAGWPAAVPAAMRPGTSRTEFVAITPCRAIDTRPARIGAGTMRNFVLRGTAGFAAQGGKSGGCGIPVTATGVAVSVSSVNIGGAGYFRIWPYGQSDPGATIAHYQSGPITTTGGTVTLGAPGQSYDVTAEAFDAAAGLVVDVTGYYDSPIQAEIAPDGTVYAGGSHVVSSTHTATGNYTVVLDQNVSGCAVTAGMAGGQYYVSAAVSGNTLYGETWSLAGGSATDRDLYWYFTVTC